MAGPRMIGIKDVINPYAELQESVSRVGDIYQNYEKDRRASQLHAEEMAEFERAESARQYLNSFTPELGGADFRGIDAETKKAMMLEEGKILESLGPDATPEEHQRVRDEITNRRKLLVTREAVTSDVYNDLVRNHVDPTIAQHLAAIEGSKYESLDERYKSILESSKLARDDIYKRGELAVNSVKAHNPGNRSYTGGGSGGGGAVAERGVKVLDTDEKVLGYLKGTVSAPYLPKIDANKAFADIKTALDLVNRDRSENQQKPISLADISNLISYSVTHNEWDNDVIYKSPGEWKQAIDKHLVGGTSQGRSFVTSDNERAAIDAALQGVESKTPTRAEFIAKRVRGVYGDLYSNLKNTTVGDDGKIEILGGTGRSGTAGGSTRTGGEAAGQPASGGGSSILDSLAASESGGNWNALNEDGYGGRLQFGDARLADAARAGVIPAAITGAEFSRLSPEEQMAVEQWHINDIDQQAERMGLGQYIGQTVAGIPITRDGIRGMAHLGGMEGAARFLQSGGQYNPVDSNGTSLADYALRHGGAGTGTGAGRTDTIAGTGAGSRIDTATTTPGVGGITENSVPLVIIPDELWQERAGLETRLDAITSKPESDRSVQERQELGIIESRLSEIHNTVESLRTEQANASGGQTPPAPLPDSALPPELVAERDALQANIERLAENPASQAFLASQLRKQQSRLEEVENALEMERSRPRVTAAYNEAQNAGVGTNVPPELYSLRRTGAINAYPVDQLPQLKEDIDAEIARYNAVLQYARLNGDQRTASQTRSRIGRLLGSSNAVKGRIRRLEED